MTAPCDDCGTPTRDRGIDARLDPDWYAVEDATWAGAGMAVNTDTEHPSKGHYLCLACLAFRLGRPLVTEDFADAPINVLYRPVSDPDRVVHLGVS